MCGIFASNDPFVKKKHEKLINKYLYHRGPDFQSGLLSINNFKLYHSRLVIIGNDKKYNQPYHCNDGSILLFNGEIFNYKELSLKYNIKNIESDTHLLSEIIIKKNFDPNELDGFFSIIRISKDGKILNCIRDHFGVKPLYYFKRKGFISICSEPAILKLIFNLKVNESAIEEYKIFRYPLFSNSFYSGIEELMPGNCLINGEFFNSLNFYTKYFQRLSLINLEKKIKISINSRLVSDVPVALLLSSGIDSNLIKYFSGNIKFYTGGFEDDIDYLFLKKNKTANLSFIKINKNNFIDRFNSLLNLRQEPLSVPNEVVLSMIADQCKNDGYKVLLSGEGADEFFGGYDRIFGLFSKIQKFNLDEFCKLYCYGVIDKNSLYYNKLSDFFRKINYLSPFEMVRQFFIKHHLRILFRRLDFSLMSSGVEGREPLASKILFEFAMRVKSKSLIQKDIGKKPLRDISQKYYGKDFAYSKKIGFPINLKRIFNEPQFSSYNNYDIWFKKNLEILI